MCRMIFFSVWKENKLGTDVKILPTPFSPQTRFHKRPFQTLFSSLEKAKLYFSSNIYYISLQIFIIFLFKYLIYFSSLQIFQTLFSSLEKAIIYFSSNIYHISIQIFQTLFLSLEKAKLYFSSEVELDFVNRVVLFQVQSFTREMFFKKICTK